MPLENPLPSVHTRATPGPAPGGLGRGLFASTTIKVGEDVLNITSPFVAVLDTPRLSDTCSGCLGSGPFHHSGPLKNCTGCKVVKYCDRVYTPCYKYYPSKPVTDTCTRNAKEKIGSLPTHTNAQSSRT
ncbi:unnamed protein product [Aspergillus oryzae]|uniref:Unnamed protein product n=2 Tax=Aspergillus oryzae TaxID=5062 RepID=A0AAN4YWJ5_ASPOZ|nr:unnamed protein product [Aspergillus oryzae]GMF95605.1 unnamed protein product [Aspergillus oryzae]GMG09222.1 unnamed protein product [Aspergillus oryzae]GMG34829.1 unnamed protein product [Aspergillus oryzae]GMG53209.1 unnamed protein product [Aspergillus oryzae var. brunneus]